MPLCKNVDCRNINILKIMFNIFFEVHCNPYRGLQGNPCNEKRDLRTGVPCNENRVFPVGIGSQGVPCELYRVWVNSARLIIKSGFKSRAGYNGARTVCSSE